MRPADEQHNVTRANQHYVSAFQAKGCVDNRAARVQRKFMSFNVLAFISGRRNSDVQGAGLARRLAGFMNRSGGGAGEKDFITTRDRSARAIAFSRSIVAVTASADPMTPIFIFMIIKRVFRVGLMPDSLRRRNRRGVSRR